MTGDGELHVDYAVDLGQLLKEDKPNVKPGDDIRQLLVDKYPVVPAYSIPYTVDENGEPIYDMETYNADVKRRKSDKNKRQKPPRKRTIANKLLTFVRGFFIFVYRLAYSEKA